MNHIITWVENEKMTIFSAFSLTKTRPYLVELVKGKQSGLDKLYKIWHVHRGSRTAGLSLQPAYTLPCWQKDQAHHNHAASQHHSSRPIPTISAPALPAGVAVKLVVTGPGAEQVTRSRLNTSESLCLSAVLVGLFFPPSISESEVAR